MTSLQSRWTTAVAILCSAAGIVNAATNDSLHLPAPGFHELRVISPTVLELTLITTKEPDPAAPAVWNFVNRDGKAQLPKAENLLVSAGGKPVAVSEVGFKRRVAYAPLQKRDLRIGNYLYLKLKEALPENATVEVKERSGTNVLRGSSFRAAADPRRYGPAIHVNQTGYVPGFPKKAFVGYYLGSLGELEISKPKAPGLPFAIVDVSTGQTNFQGTLKSRPDRGFTFRCYQNVFEADFTQFKTPGEYRMLVPGLGMSFPFYIGDGAAALFARTYALGLYHQRCGTNNTLPYTRFCHGVCHTGLVEIPTLSLTNTQWFLAQSSEDYKSDPRHKAPQLKDTESSLYPFVRRGKIDAAGGHHDAGDYSKYTANSAGLIHTLITAVDAFAGVTELDNLGLPESGDGISDLLQEAKWEADFLAKLQDDDGGFYFLVYPRERRYENDVEPDRGDPQIVWPKTTAATAAAVAALAQCASSPAMKKAYPDAAATYLAKARKGWQFLKAALEKYGEDGSYQKITHYGHEFFHDDELAWAACELYLATRETDFHKYLSKSLNPADPGIRKWSWWRMWEGYGCAIRSYALAIKTGKVSRQQLDMGLLARCEDETAIWAEELLNWSQESAYGASFPAPSKRSRNAGWYFSCDPAFDLAVAAQLDYPSMKDPRPKLLEAIVANLNYEGGANPVNVSYITGLGWHRQREIVHQTAQNDRRVMPASGIPLGSIQAGFGWLEHYKRELGALTYPPDSAEDSPYPFYDRWGDSFNLSQEFVILNQGHGLAAWAWLFAQTPLRNQPWKPVPLQIAASGASSANVDARVVASGSDLKGARVLWEAEGQEPTFSQAFTIPIRLGQKPWVEAEVQFADGRLAFAATNVTSGNSVRKLSQK